jgi:hypothetical protein
MFAGKQYRIILPIVLLMLLVSSCIPGMRTARKFVQEKEQKPAVMVVPPSFTFINFYPFDPANPQDQFNNPGNLEDSGLLHDFDENQANEKFMDALYNHLEEYPVRVFRPEEFDQFLAYPGDRFIFTIAQTEIIEYDQPFTDRALIDTLVYRQDFLLRHVARNTWFEFVKVDDSSSDGGMQVLYSNFYTGDQVNGRFRYQFFSGDVIYQYTSRIIDSYDVDQMNRFAGYRNARYIFEHLLNRYVQKNARPFLSEPGYFRFNVYDGSLSRGREDERFIIIGQP